MRLLKKLHKWLGLLIGIQVLLWLLSGLMISLIDPLKASGKQWVSTSEVESNSPLPATIMEPAELATKQLQDALEIELTTRHGKPVYLIKRADGETLVNAVDGSIIKIDKNDAARLARKDFSGDGEIVSIEPGIAPDMETRNHNGAYWRVSFSDQANSAIYISASTGQILERRNSYWRLRDFFWMLHIMDYSGRQNFNNSLVITTALIAVWLGISGFLLLFGSYRRVDFYFLNIRGKSDDVLITLVDPMASSPRHLKLRKGSNLFLSLATHDIQLPSICGGGGECGKCRVKFEASDSSRANTVELGLIPGNLRLRGHRLACQQEVQNNMVVHLPAGTLVRDQSNDSSLT